MVLLKVQTEKVFTLLLAATILCSQERVLTKLLRVMLANFVNFSFNGAGVNISPEIATQSSHSVHRAGWQAKMASIGRHGVMRTGPFLWVYSLASSLLGNSVSCACCLPLFLQIRKTLLLNPPRWSAKQRWRHYLAKLAQEKSAFSRVHTCRVILASCYK